VWLEEGAAQICSGASRGLYSWKTLHRCTARYRLPSSGSTFGFLLHVLTFMFRATSRTGTLTAYHASVLVQTHESETCYIHDQEGGCCRPVERRRGRLILCFSQHLNSMWLSPCFNNSNICCNARKSTLRFVSLSPFLWTLMLENLMCSCSPLTIIRLHAFGYCRFPG
jgi:hypothetical protein